MLFNIDIVNFVRKTDEAESMLIFDLWRCLESSVDDGRWGEAVSLI